MRHPRFVSRLRNRRVCDDSHPFWQIECDSRWAIRLLALKLELESDCMSDEGTSPRIEGPTLDSLESGILWISRQASSYL